MDTFSTLLYDSTQIDDRTLVYATNTGPVDITIRHEGRAYTLPVGQRITIPWTAMTLWFGDPLSRDRGGSENNRTKELHRLKFKWGIHTGPIPETPYGGPGTQGFPSVECTDLMDGAVPTVITDPSGTALDAGPGDANEVSPAQIQQQIEAMQQQLNRMLEQTPITVPDAPTMTGVDRPDGTKAHGAIKAPAKKGPKRDGT